MKQIYVIAIFFLPFYCFSQLYVQPGENRESYVFVVDELFYVQKQIHLTPNSNGMANLYLRNEAQLLQGDENSPNTGQGSLSVFQEGKANAYTYNYWSSPVDDLPGKEQVEDIIYEPQSRLLSSKANITGHLNGWANPLTISSRWIYKLHGSSYGEWTFLGNNFDLEPGEGFTMKGVDGINNTVIIYGVSNNPGNEQRYDFRGKPNNGLIVRQVRKSEVRLIGNPYPSAFDLDAFLLDNSNITGIAYFWDSAIVSSHYLQDYEGGYGAYSPSVGSNGYVPAVFYKYDSNGDPIENTGNTGNHYSRRFSPIAQGFVVEGLENGPIYFRNSYRVYQKEDLRTSQFKLADDDPKISESNSSLRINIQFNDTYTRQLLLAFNPASTNGVDRAMDARNLMPLPTDAAWLLEHREYLINVKPFDEQDIPLFFSIAKTSTVDLSLAERENFDQNVFLYDQLENRYFNLNQKASLFLEKGDYTERFYLTFDKPENNIEETLTIPEIAVFQNNPEKRTEIRTSQDFTAERITLFDISGRKLDEIKGSSEKQEYRIPTEKYSSGYYIIKIKSQDGAVISKKVIISN